MEQTIRIRRGPQTRLGGEIPVDASPAIRELRQHTDGLSNRLPLASLESMRAGTVGSPHTLTRRYFLAAKRIGLSRAWACRFVVWVTNQVDCIWTPEPTSRIALRRKALRAEAIGDECELVTMAAESPVAMRAEADALKQEIAADMALLAHIEQALATVDA